MDKSLKIAIDAQLLPGSGAGGVESVLIGLVHALGQLKDGQEEYIIVGPYQEPKWLKPYMGPNQRIVSGPDPNPPRRESQSNFRFGLRPFRLVARKLYNTIVISERPPEIPKFWPEVPVSDGFYEGLGCHVIHFPIQSSFVVCAIPSIYNPHDLQHLHYPQFFRASTIAWRETIYRAGCHFASTVAVASQWTKEDVIKHYHVHPYKIQVIPWAPPTQAYPEPGADSLTNVREKYGLNSPFALYPAMAWEHKNHIRLLEALALLRDRHGLIVNLVCTGNQSDFRARIQERLLALGLQEQVKFLDVVPPIDLRALYRLAQFVIIPSLFEAASGPLFETWQDDTPVACSFVTSLPDQAGNAALLFDPFSVETISEAVAKMAANPDLREELRRRGAKRLQDFSWERTAKAYRAVYRRATGYPLSEEDKWLLSWDWMREPQRKTEAES